MQSLKKYKTMILNKKEKAKSFFQKISLSNNNLKIMKSASKSYFSFKNSNVIIFKLEKYHDLIENIKIQ